MELNKKIYTRDAFEFNHLPRKKKSDDEEEEAAKIGRNSLKKEEETAKEKC